MGDSIRSTGLADPVMLHKIDKLFACNVGEYIDLPQIVVVGDQSSGKSSVLEGTTAMPFPRDSGLCTRFATQITFRRAVVRRTAISIVAGKYSSSEHAEELRAWSKDIDSLDHKTFSEIMQEVPRVMGISDNPLHLKTFSDDILCMEISGPDEAHLSVIDIPGIFKRTTQGVTSKADIQMVKSMVQGYMENPRSVILAVIPANVDIATQEILEMAEEVDPKGERTLGVLTKPDLVDKGAEGFVIDLIEGRSHQLALGWHLVRNPGHWESTDPTANRHVLEQTFFETNFPYTRLGKDKVGVQALKNRLQEILATHTRHEFPKVKSELNRRLKSCKASLATLGSSRATPAAQSKYLIDIASRFQEVVSLALDAKYWADDIFDDFPDLRLATLMVSRSEAFSDMVKNSGHTYQFDTAEISSSSKASSKKSSKKMPLPISFDSITEPPRLPTWKADEDKHTGEPGTTSLCTRLNEDHEDLEDILVRNEELAFPESQGILPWLTMVYRSSRGFELGTFDPSLLAITMREQSKKWNAIAKGYISDAVTIVHNFVARLLQLVCPDTRVCNGLSFLLMDGLLDRYKKANVQVEFVLSVERSKKPATQNHYFNDTLEKCRQKRMQQGISAKSFDDCSHGTVVRIEDIMIHHPMSNIEHTVQDLHDILKSYYQVAWKRVVDVICMQAAEYYLISGPETPLKLFSPAFVGGMTSEQLQEVAGEDAGQIHKRTQLQKEIDDLERGKRILM